MSERWFIADSSTMYSIPFLKHILRTTNHDNKKIMKQTRKSWPKKNKKTLQWAQGPAERKVWSFFFLRMLHLDHSDASVLCRKPRKQTPSLSIRAPADNVDGHLTETRVSPLHLSNSGKLCLLLHICHTKHKLLRLACSFISHELSRHLANAGKRGERVLMCVCVTSSAVRNEPRPLLYEMSSSSQLYDAPRTSLYIGLLLVL